MAAYRSSTTGIFVFAWRGVEASDVRQLFGGLHLLDRFGDAHAARARETIEQIAAREASTAEAPLGGAPANGLLRAAEPS